MAGDTQNLLNERVTLGSLLGLDYKVWGPWSLQAPYVQQEIKPGSGQAVSSWGPGLGQSTGNWSGRFFVFRVVGQMGRREGLPPKLWEAEAHRPRFLPLLQ